MLTIAECREYLEDQTITDSEVENVRDDLYVLARLFWDKNENEKRVCKQQ